MARGSWIVAGLAGLVVAGAASAAPKNNTNLTGAAASALLAAAYDSNGEMTTFGKAMAHAAAAGVAMEHSQLSFLGDDIADFLTSGFDVALQPGMWGDTNGDLHINQLDLNNVIATWMQNGDGLAGDVNFDSTVNFGDLNIVLGALSEVPAPGATALAGLALLTLARRRR